MKNIFQRFTRGFYAQEWSSLLRIFSRNSWKQKPLQTDRRRVQNSLRSLRKLTGIYWLIGAFVSLQIVLWQHPDVRTNAAMPVIQGPLSTKDSQILDKNGKPVLLRGVNWFGMETDLHVPHGLWTRDYKEMLAQIRGLGYNFIRLPFSVQAIRSSNISGVDFNIGSNRDLQGKTPLQVMDIIIQESARQGISIMLDSHRLSDARIPELWYGDGYTETDWIESWKLLANRYKNQPNVVAADLKNEPHGQASWGTNNMATDWRLAAERCGNAILGIAPNWLIVVEGVEKNVPGQQLSGHWWGGNLEGVKNNPVRLNIGNRVVYSPHEYGAGVYNASWFSEPTFPQNLYQRWQLGFQYIADSKIAPILIGEFGGRQVDASSKEGIWQRQLVDFIKQKNLAFTYWSWNPNSGDTGGILLDDWKTVDSPKQQLLNTLLSASTTPTTPTPTPTPTPTGSLSAAVVVTSEWNSGICFDFNVTNRGNTPTRNWLLRFTPNQAQITQTWNGTFVTKGSTVEASPNADWAKIVQPGKTVNVGYCANKTGGNFRPSNVSVANL
ncbi:MAG: cellulase family glycosylhydrolase [Scytonematopsis contorta HA4267-MV1]|jgi:endoglucanase|nr:cellulase family glycosylhydrolase [Scytonematopsis contorta HA4267-MV1]